MLLDSEDLTGQITKYWFSQVKWIKCFFVAASIVYFLLSQWLNIAAGRKEKETYSIFNKGEVEQVCFFVL